jgi:thymidylate synthase
MLEVLQLTLVVDHPQPTDPIIDRFANAERLAWMHTNFHDRTRVPELGDADSYATRLYDYAHSGRNQLAWVVDRLRDDPRARNATITTFQPLTDTSYIPCVSLLDFWINHGALQLAAYAHGMDFGTKGFANLIELAQIQHRVADELSTPVGALTFIIKSAHIYNTELEAIRAINAAPQLKP